MQQRVFFRGPMLITLDPLGVEAADVLVADGRIARKGWRLNPPRDAEIIDARGRLLCPGLVNAHARLDASFLHLMPESGDAEGPAKLRAALTEESLIAAAFATALEAVRSGTTALFAFHEAAGFTRGALARIRDVMATVGLRASAACGVSGKLAPDSMTAVLAESKDAAVAGCGNRTAFLLGASDLAGVSEPTLAAMAEASRRYETPIHAVVSAGAEGVAEIQRLRAAGLLRPHSILVALGALPAAEAERLATEHVTVVRSASAEIAAGLGPQASAGTSLGPPASGPPALAGSALGTDSGRPDLFEQARLVFARARAAGQSVRAEDVVGMLGRAQAAASELFKAPCGSFEAGSVADLLLLDYRAATPLNASTLARHVLFGMSAASVQSVMVDGHFVVKDRTVVNVDVRNLFRQTQRGALDLWQRAIGSEFPGLDVPVRAPSAPAREETREPARFDEEGLEFETLALPVESLKPWLVCRPDAEAESAPSAAPVASPLPAAAQKPSRQLPPEKGGFGAGIIT